MNGISNGGERFVFAGQTIAARPALMDNAATSIITDSPFEPGNV
jgi:hypothetical protein